MAEMTIAQIADLVQSFGIWLLFAWLYITEKQAHEATRREYRADLRLWAGLAEQVIIRPPGAVHPPEKPDIT